MGLEYKLARNFLQSLKGEINWIGLSEIIFPKRDVVGNYAFSILDV